VKNSDYKKKRTNLNSLVPNVLQTTILKTLNENTFNRFFTPEEYEHVVGILGDLNPKDASAFQIPDKRPANQRNQLQPVPHVKIGAVDKQMSFDDMLGRMELAGIDTEAFAEWGKSLQFNWVPPVNLDKLINYREYFWEKETDTDTPEYATIKNQYNWALAREHQAMKSVFDVMPQYSIDSVSGNVIRLSGNHTAGFRVGSFVITSDNSAYTISRVENVEFNNSSLRTEVRLSSALVGALYVANTELRVSSTDLSANTFTVSGDLTPLVRNGFVIRAASGLESASYFTVRTTLYRRENNTTVINPVEAIGSINFNVVDLLPFASLMRGETLSLLSGDSAYRAPLTPTWSNLVSGEMVWVREYSVIPSRVNASVGATSSNLSDRTINLVQAGVVPGDVVRIITGPNRGEYPVLSVSRNSLNLYVETGRFFIDNSLTYEVIRKREFSALANTPATIGAVRYSPATDTVSRYDGQVWVVVERNLSRLLHSTNNRHLVNTRQADVWSTTNRWKHKTQISSFDNVVRAQVPIIEFDPFLELANYSYTSKDWSYRKSEDSDYVSSVVVPTLLELHDIRLFGGDEFAFAGSRTIVLNPKYGYMGDSLAAGDSIRLSGFSGNDGVYTVAAVDFAPQSPASKYRTVITLRDELKNTGDLPLGASLGPLTTSHGDAWLGFDSAQWRFDGIRETVASGNTKPANPHYGTVFASDIGNPSNLFDSTTGLNWQEFALRNHATLGASLALNPVLHDLVLREDYQEGDLRVYINGVRQYGNFSDLESYTSPDYVGGIRFDADVLITNSDKIRVELGEHNLSDMGKRAVPVHTVNGVEYTNLVDYRKVEQVKTVRGQSPVFSLYDMDGNALDMASEIFAYEESPSYAVNLHIGKRVSSGDIGFSQKLMSSDGKLYFYKDNSKTANPFSSIWRKGSKNETYRPTKTEGTWDIPNQLKYNVHHENRETVKFSEMFRHFKTIIDAQEVSGMFTKDGQAYHLDDNINFGAGGTIKEHNGGFDMLTSAMFLDNTSPVDVIRFAHEQYASHLHWLHERLRNDIVNLLNSEAPNVSTMVDAAAASIVAAFESSDRLDLLFGDSTSAVKNWVASPCYLGLMRAVRPHVIRDDTLGILEVVHHTGQRSEIKINSAEKQLLLRSLIKKGVATSYKVANHAAAFTTVPSAANGHLLVRIAPTGSELYRYSVDGTWEHVNLIDILSSAILSVEERLFAGVPDGEHYSTDVSGKSGYNEKLRAGFEDYVISNAIDNPFINRGGFSTADPFTWNYSFSTLQYNPSNSPAPATLAGSWQALYQQVYGTPYPHLEPWVLQGYNSKPVWWDGQYRNTEIGSNRRWVQFMWLNILRGVVPTSGRTPSGAMGNGFAGQTAILFNSVPVNIDTLPTKDKIQPDGLIPPYWNSSNTSNIGVKPLFDANQQHDVVTPHLDYEFGSDGIWEWKWKSSLQFSYDKLVAAFQLDPMNFINNAFDGGLVSVGCLQLDGISGRVRSHRDVIFHGDFLDATNGSYTSNGLNQWYVHCSRYNGLDGENSELRMKWTKWDAPLTYLFGSFIDPQSFSISSGAFDMTDKDYRVAVKQTKNMEVKKLSALTATLLAVPSKYSPTRELGIGWTASFSPTAKIVGLSYHPVQNYPFRSAQNSSLMEINSFKLDGAEINSPNAYRVVGYNQSLGLSDGVYFDGNAGATYSATITVDGVANVIAVPGNTRTVADVIAIVNSVLGSTGEAKIELGNISIKSNSIGPSSNISIVDNGLFSNIKPVSFSGISGLLTSSYKFKNVMYVKGNYSVEFAPGTTFTVSSSSVLNGDYTVVKSSFDVNSARTKIVVKENRTIDGSDQTGVIRITNGRTLPVTWTTGKEVYLNSVGALPAPFDEYTPYYIIRVSDTTFRLAETPDAAAQNIAVTVLSDSVGLSYVGNIERTFKALSGRTSKTNWRKHVVDTSTTLPLTSSIVVSGIQQMVDLITGYESMATTVGFETINPDGDNRDEMTRRGNGWQVETEKFIDAMFTSRALRNEDNLMYRVSPDNSTNKFVYSGVATLQTGTPVLLLPVDGARLPTKFDNIISENTPYYVIRVDNGAGFQLAASRLDAKKGIAVPFSDNGTGDAIIQVYRKIDSAPRFELNPFKSNLWVNHAIGILSSVTDDTTVKFPARQVVLDNEGKTLSVADLHTFREDTRSRISLVGSIDASNGSQFTYSKVSTGAASTKKAPVKYMTGFDLRFEGYEHSLILNSRAIDNSLIYDSFLGLRTPRFISSFTRQVGFTLRPNMGGFILQDGGLSPNFESAINDMRNYYDAYGALEYKGTTGMVRDMLGYNGSIGYMDDVQISPKTQFLFWRGMIQNKGTNLAINAFANQPLFSNVGIDEFWAYRLGEFGESKKRMYPEVKLFVSDVTKKEIRLEFTGPEGGVLDDSFAEVKATDITRWWDQPDVLEDVKPDRTFYYGVKVTSIIEDASSLVVGDTLTFDGPHDGAIITYRETVNGEVKIMVDGVDFEFVNARAIKFIRSLVGLLDLTVATISYDAQASGPCQVIDKKDGAIVDTAPLWHPAIGQHYQIAHRIVDVENDADPAVYTDKIGTVLPRPVWGEAEVGKVWMDTSVADYVPYYDKAIFRNATERVFNWGKLADWGDISLFQWTASTTHPDDWDKKVELDIVESNISRKRDGRTGTVLKKLYRNVEDDPSSPPIWEEVQDEHRDFLAININANSSEEMTGEHEVYVNGKFVGLVDFSTNSLADVLSGTVSGLGTVATVSSYIHTIKRSVVPTQDEMDSGLFKYATPYSTATKFDPVKNAEYTVYYYWVTGKTDAITSATGQTTTLVTAEKDLIQNPSPYMILSGLRPGDSGYGIVFGNVFDEDDNKLPYRYTQLTIRGLNGKVKDEERYALRLCKDSTLRDSLPTGDGLESYLDNKNLHVEWKLIREKQIYRIDQFLWDRLIEAAIGHEVTNSVPNWNTTLPSLNRVVFDNIYGTDSKFGLGADQVLSDRNSTLSTIIGTLRDPNIVFSRVDITEFLAGYDFKYKSDVVDALNTIYNTFTVDEINTIFFAVLNDAMVYKKQSSDIFKTSWVALQISQLVTSSGAPIYNELNLVPGEACGVEDFVEVAQEPLPSPTPTPTPSPTESVTPTPTATPTPTLTTTPTPTATVTVTPTVTVSPSVTASVTPTPTVTRTVTPTPTESVTPTESETPTPTPTESVTPSVTESETPTPTPTESETPTPTPTESVTPSVTESETPTPTPTESETPTPTPTESVTPSVTESETPTPTPTESETPTPTPTESETPTPTPSGE
jgi:hypothetical protein